MRSSRSGGHGAIGVGVGLVGGHSGVRCSIGRTAVEGWGWSVVVAALRRRHDTVAMGIGRNLFGIKLVPSSMGERNVFVPILVSV